MSDTLTEICNRKREHIAAQKTKMPETELYQRALAAPPPRGFHSALKKRVTAGEIGLIAEVKKASPSKGLIRADFEPASIATAYEQSGATCVSVLTDTPYFQGEDAHLLDVRSAIKLPVLRKDFILDPYQILESRSLGADCILLIMAALGNEQANELEFMARDLGMDVLIEVHDETETERALTHLRSKLIGINNRNLKTLEVNLSTSEQLRKNIPDDYTLVCESGIATHADITRMRNQNIHCFLVGESLTRQPDIATATKTLLGTSA